MSNSTSDLKRKIVNSVVTAYSREISLLYPCQSVEEVVKQLSKEKLTDLATKAVSLLELTEIFGVPEIKSVYWQIIQNNPRMNKMYPDVDLFKLPQNQLERLTRGDNIQEVLGKPDYDSDVLSMQNPNPMDPPKNNITANHGNGSPKQALTSSKGTRVSAADSYRSNYRGMRGGN